VCVCLTQHGLGDGEGDGGPAGHPPPGGQVGDLRPQHLNDHLVVQSQVELLVVHELGEGGGDKERRGEFKVNIYKLNLKLYD